MRAKDKGVKLSPDDEAEFDLLQAAAKEQDVDRSKRETMDDTEVNNYLNIYLIGVIVLLIM